MDLQRVSFANAGTFNNTGVLDNGGRVVNEASGVFHVGAGSTVNNYWLLDNYGTLTVQQGKLESNGWVYNGAGATLTNFGEISGTGSITNDGNIENHALLVVANTVLNHGSIANLGAGAEIRVVNGGSIWVFDQLSTDGTLSLDDAGLYVQANALLENSGLLTTGGTTSNAGTWLSTIGSMVVKGDFYNEGSLTSYGLLANRGYLQNTGTLALAGTQSFEAGSRLLNANELELGGSSVLESGASLDNYWEMALDGDASFDSFGSVYNAGRIVLRGEMRNFNVFNNAVEATLTLVDGTLTNAGYLWNGGQFRASSGSVISSGLIVNSGSFEMPANTFFEMSGVFENDGFLFLGSSVDFTGGTVYNRGTLITTFPVDFGAANWGAIALLPGGKFVNDGGATVVDGYTLLNEGRIEGMGAFSVAGWLINEGAFEVVGNVDVTGNLDNRAVMTLPSLANFGQTDNRGTLNVVVQLNNAGTLTNDGQLSTPALVNTGSLANNPLGFVTTTSLVNTASVRNEGRVVVDGLFDNSGNYLGLGNSATDVQRVMNSGALNISPSGLFVIRSELRNAGQLNNGGELRVLGNLLNGEPGSSPSALLVNTGNLQISAGANMFNLATVSNAGTITNQGSFSNRGELLGNGSLRNDGVFDNLATASMRTLVNTADTFNTGTLTVDEINNTGRIDNRGYLEAGALVNSGRVAQDDGFTFTVAGSFENSGVIQNAGSLAMHGGFRTNGLFVNSGSTTFGAAGNGSAVELRGTVQNSGSMLNYGSTTLVAGSSFTNEGVIVNRGIWLAQGDITGANGRVENHGHWTASAGMTADRFTNLGTYIVETSTVAVGTLTNSGTLFQSGGASRATVFFNDGDALATGGTLELGNLVNRGQFESREGSQLSAAIADNQGSMQVHAATFGTLHNAGSFAGTQLRVSQVTNEPGGHFESSISTRIDSSFVNSGTANINGLTSGAGQYFQYAGSTAFEGHVNLAGLFLDGGMLCGSASLGGTPVNVNGGTLCPGLSPGTMTLGGPLQFNSGVVEIEIAGLATGAYDRLILDGPATFAGGVLRIAFTDGFVPQVGDDWLVILGGGQFSGLASLNTQVLGLPAGYLLAFNANSQGMTVAVVAVPEPTGWVLGLAAIAALGLTRRWQAGNDNGQRAAA